MSPRVRYEHDPVRGTTKRIVIDTRLEKKIEAACMEALGLMGFNVTKTSQPRASMVTEGIPDLYARHPRWGLRLWVEVKAGRNKPSAVQIAWHEAERAAGGVVIVVWSVADLVEELKKLGAPIS